jgi:hypothetical protein
MTGDGTPVGTRVELFARSSLPSAVARRRDTVIGRLEGLAEDGHIATLDVHTWEKKVPVDGNAFENVVYEAFHEWAGSAGVELSPFFDTRECYSSRTGERGTRLVLPALSVAVYRDDDLQSVYPHSTATDARTVMDCLHALESGHGQRDEDPDTERRPVEAAD